MTKQILTQDELKRHLHYNAETGIFTRKTNCSKRKIGDSVGTLDREGYRVINFSGKPYRAHRLAWFYVYGEWPTKDLDHINRIKDDNRICNLRLASISENIFNTTKRNTNTSGYKGVYSGHKPNKWIARCQVDGTRKHLGVFNSAESASQAYNAFAKKHHGEFYYDI